jgi:undecaprenyl-diphosphatase
MNLFQAAILGAVEGLTEFLPVSSTGHLILTAHAMGLSGDTMSAFEVVIQLGALLAVVWLYRERVLELLVGAVRPHPRGRALLVKLTVAFLPAALVGLAAHKWIKGHLFGPRPVAVALVLGGIALLVAARWLARRRDGDRSRLGLDEITVAMALAIGLAQCLSLWPGTSRAMVTLLAAMLLGATPVAAAEFSFLLALPTLGAATVFDLLQNWEALTGSGLGGALAVGLVTSAVVAVLAIRGFLKFVTTRGLAPFGWYRIAVGIAVIAVLWNHPAGGAP